MAKHQRSRRGSRRRSTPESSGKIESNTEQTSSSNLLENPDDYADAETEPVKKAASRRGEKTLFERIQDLFIPKKGKRLRTNRHMFYTSIVVVVLFLVLIVYLVRFTAYDSAQVIANPYNKRTETLSERVTRGDILSANDKVLAETETDADGEETRVYPYENMFAHVVGYTGHGKAGLESVCNYDLLTSNENVLRKLTNGLSGKKDEGDSIVTTLDTRLQKAAYEALGDYTGSVIAIEPKTGKVRAMVSKPDFDPNNLDAIWDEINEDSDNSCLLNRSTQGLYPPGSTYKLITTLEYIEEYPDTFTSFSYDCTGETIVNSVHISCYEGEEHGHVDLEEAFADSCNTAYVTLGSEFDVGSFLSLNEKCLFNKSISFDLSVKKSRFELDENSEDSELPQTVIGQGDTLMTPFHNALLMCAVANDGVLMQPYLVEETVTADGAVVNSVEPEKYKTICSEEEAEILQGMLRSVVTDGTGYALKTDLYTAAGKTGTAENEKENAHSWFVGYSNVDDPDLVVCVLVENTGAGSQYAAPIAKQVFDSYYNNNMDEYYSD